MNAWLLWTILYYFIEKQWSRMLEGGPEYDFTGQDNKSLEMTFALFLIL